MWKAPVATSGRREPGAESGRTDREKHDHPSGIDLLIADLDDVSAPKDVQVERSATFTRNVSGPPVALS